MPTTAVKVIEAVEELQALRHNRRYHDERRRALASKVLHGAAHRMAPVNIRHRYHTKRFKDLVFEIGTCEDKYKGRILLTSCAFSSIPKSAF
jgi:hypothetical protein